ncbi:MAG: type VI secretion system baseplate subunit TssE [Holosporaceae bacterium]|jgi:type VI secretion system lysozyme-like protein|nr:type VI secretion system baseplate subunit TssE [Holosporaceae bacterium]
MGNLIPLFEKLTDEDPEASFERIPKRVSTVDELKQIIGEDLSRLLNTRVPSLWRNVCEITTPFSYGVNVTAPTSAESVFEIQELEARINYVIRQFEPRLLNAQAHVASSGGDPSILFVNIEALMKMEDLRIPLSFPVVIGTLND